MKKLFLHILILQLACFSGSAQSLLLEEPASFIGIHAISNWNAPVFGSYYHLKKDAIGFGIKAGLGAKNDEGYVYEEPYNNTLGWSVLKFNSSYYYLTPVFIPRVFNRESKLFFLSIGLPTGYSNDQLIMKTSSDPLYGSITNTYQETHFYQGVEVELQYWFDIGPRLTWTTGINTGKCLIGKAPFQAQLYNGNASNVYFPGMSKGIYINLHLGLSFKIN